METSDRGAEWLSQTPFTLLQDTEPSTWFCFYFKVKKHLLFAEFFLSISSTCCSTTLQLPLKPGALPWVPRMAGGASLRRQVGMRETRVLARLTPWSAGPMRNETFLAVNSLCRHWNLWLWWKGLWTVPIRGSTDSWKVLCFVCSEWLLQLQVDDLLHVAHGKMCSIALQYVSSSNDHFKLLWLGWM